MDSQRSSHNRIIRLAACALLSLLLLMQFPALLLGAPQTVIAAVAASAPASHAAIKARAQAGYGNLPLQFEANRGQFDARVKFALRHRGVSLALTGTEAVIGSVRMRMIGANTQAVISGVEPLPGKTHYFLGNDPKRWRTEVPTYGRVKYEAVYPGIDLVFYGNRQQLEYDFVVAASADPSAIKLRFAGARRLRLLANGDLILETKDGQMRQRKPYVYQEINGGKREVAGRYIVKGREVSFALGTYDASLPLVIDPVLSYSTFLGGSDADIGEAIAVDAGGNAYITGRTALYPNMANPFPTTPGVPKPTGDFASSYYIFVTKLNAEGSAPVYSAIIGGTQGVLTRGSLLADNTPQGIAVDAGGNAYVTGATYTANFPTTAGAIQTQPRAGNDAYDAFLLKLNAQGGALVYSTLLGQGNARGYAVAVDGAGQAWVTGNTGTLNFPVTADAFQKIPKNRGNAAFASKLNATGTQLLYSTFLSSGSGEWGNSIAVDANGNAYVAGTTGSSCARNDGLVVEPFPTTEGAFRRDLGEGCIGPGSSSFTFVTKFAATGALVYSTLLGVSNGGYVAADAQGNAYITGQTAKLYNFPVTSGAFQTEIIGPPTMAAAFVAKLNAQGSALIYSTYLNGATGNYGGWTRLAVNQAGNACVTGALSAPTFVRTTTDPPFNASRGVFVTKLNPAGNALVHSVVIGEGSANGIALDVRGDAYITGETNSDAFPTTAGAFQRQRHNSAPYVTDAFVAKVGESATQQPQARWSTTSSSRFTTGSFTFTHGTYTKLHNGSVIATGSASLSGTDEMLRSVEIYDPLTEKWRDAEPMHFPRSRHDALLLADGRLLVIGGFKPNASPPYVYAGPPEIFDPATGKWTVLPVSGEDLAPRYTLIPNYPLPLLLPNGKVILFVGMRAIQPLLLDLSNNAVSAGPFAPQYNDGLGRGSSSAVVMHDGKVLLFVSRRILIYDPTTLAWSEGNVPKNNGIELGGQITALLPSGEPFALLNTLLTPEQPDRTFFSGVLNPSTQSWQRFAQRSFNDLGANEAHSIVLAQGNAVLTIEGNTATVYDTVTGEWKRTSDPQGTSWTPSPTLLADGRVLAANQLYGLDFGNSAAPTIVNTSAASFRVESLARGSIASVFGANLSGAIRIKDFNGVERNVDRIFAATPNQINFLVPDAIAQGQAEMTIGNQRGLLSIAGVAPGIFTGNADGRGVPAAMVLRTNFDGTQVYEPVARFDPATGRAAPVEIAIAGPAGDAYLVLFGTGWRNRLSASNVTVYIGGVAASVLYAGPQGDFAGLDQMNIFIPRSLAGRGDVDVLVTVDGKTANPVKLRIK